MIYTNSLRVGCILFCCGEGFVGGGGGDVLRWDDFWLID